MSEYPLALVTGANRGLGLEFTQQLLRRAYRVVATCRSPESATQLRRIRQSFPKQLEILTLEVDNADDRKSLYAYFRQMHSVIDLLINNAGIAHWDTIKELSEDRIIESIRVNALSPLVITREMLPFLERSRNARVAMITSRVGSMELTKDNGFKGFAYPISKAAMNMAGVQLAQALAPRKVSVFMQSPGWVKTDMGGPNATSSVSESVRNMLDIFEKVTPKQTGCFFSETGDLLPW
ncbi:MAG: SDR family oxidoreductase [Verrucomicrobiota bacterium]